MNNDLNEEIKRNVPREEKEINPSKKLMVLNRIKTNSKIIKMDDYYTPRYVLDVLEKEFNITFDLDPASCVEANEELNIPIIFTKEINGLTMDWNYKNIWLNPPFSKKKEFMMKVSEEFKKGIIENIFILLPAEAMTNKYMYNFFLANEEFISIGNIFGKAEDFKDIDFFEKELNKINKKNLFAMNEIKPRGRLKFIRGELKSSPSFGTILFHLSRTRFYGVKYIDFELNYSDKEN